MIVQASLIQKVVVALASASLLGAGGLLATNTKTIVNHEARLQNVEKMSAQIDTLSAQLSATNVNLSALNAHLEDLRRDQGK